MQSPEKSTAFWLVVETQDKPTTVCRKGPAVSEVSYSFVARHKTRAELDCSLASGFAGGLAREQKESGPARYLHIVSQEGPGCLQLFYSGATLLGYMTSTEPFVGDRESAAREFQREHSLAFAGDFVRMCGKVYPVCEFPDGEPIVDLAVKSTTGAPKKLSATIADDDPLWAELGLD